MEDTIAGAGVDSRGGRADGSCQGDRERGTADGRNVAASVETSVHKGTAETTGVITKALEEMKNYFSNLVKAPPAGSAKDEEMSEEVKEGKYLGGAELNSNVVGNRTEEKDGKQEEPAAKEYRHPERKAAMENKSFPAIVIQGWKQPNPGPVHALPASVVSPPPPSPSERGICRV